MMSERIVMRVAESLVAGGPPGTAAEPEIIIGELDGPVGTAFATLLGDQVKDIRLSSKLTDSPVCLVADEGDMDIAMEQLMAQRDTNYKGAPRILEINGDHSLIKNMKSLLSKKENNDLVSDAGTLLFEQARLMEGKMPADPAQFSKIMNQFLLKAIPTQ
jgi:molecular chaperone HtpG